MQLNDAVILIVDDEPDLLRIFRRWLELAGCRVLAAENGAKGLELARTNHIDMIVSDVRMPVMDGVEMLRQLQLGDGYLPKIILVSGFNDLVERKYYDLGVESMLQKPLRRMEFLAVVERCLTNAGERWRKSAAIAPEKTLTAQFESVPAALQHDSVEFGRGGFCMRCKFATRSGELIGLHIVFAAEPLALIGQGIVRWAEPNDGQIGIEIIYIDDENRGRTSSWVAENGSKSFIPAGRLWRGEYARI